MPKKAKKKGKKGKKKAKKSDKKEEEVPFDPNEFLPKGTDWLIISFCLVPWEAKSITMFLNFEATVTNKITIQGLHRIVSERVGNSNQIFLYFDPPKKEEPIHSQYDNYRLFELGFEGGIYTEPKRALLFFDFQPCYLSILDPTSSKYDTPQTIYSQQNALTRSQTPNYGSYNKKKPKFYHMPSLREKKIKSPVAKRLAMSRNKYQLQKSMFTFDETENDPNNTFYRLHSDSDIMMDPLLLTEPPQMMLDQSVKIKEEATEFLKMIRTQSRGSGVKLGPNSNCQTKKGDSNTEQESEMVNDESEINEHNEGASEMSHISQEEA